MKNKKKNYIEINKYNLINNCAYISKDYLRNDSTKNRVFLSYSKKYFEFEHGLLGNYGYSLDYVFLSFGKDISEKEIKKTIYQKSQFSNIVVFELEDNTLIEKWVRCDKKWFDFAQENERFFQEYIILK